MTDPTPSHDTPASAHDTEAHPAPAPDASHGTEAAHHTETTAVSNSWLKKAWEKTKRWAGHGVRLLGDELAINWGTGLITVATVGTVLSGGITAPLLISGGLGAALATGGALAEWDSGMKHASSKTEKALFITSKVAQVAGTAGAASMALLGAPAYGPIAWGLYGVGVAMGARAMAHRK